MNRSSDPDQIQLRRHRHWLKLGLLAFLTVLFVAVWQLQETFTSPAPDDNSAQSLLLFPGFESLGPLAPLAFIVLLSLFTLLFIPAATLVLSAGKIFGILGGTFYVCVGGILGATLAFLISRFLGRDWISNLFRGKRKLTALDQAIDRAGWRLIFLMRLSPIFPFNLINYMLGLTHISLSHYLIGTAAGIIPGSLIYVYLGTSLESQTTSLPPAIIARWSSLALGAIASLILLVYIIWIVHSALTSDSIGTSQEAQ